MRETGVAVFYYCRTYYKAVRVGGAAVAPRFPHTLSLFTMSGDEYFGHGPWRDPIYINQRGTSPSFFFWKLSLYKKFTRWTLLLLLTFIYGKRTLLCICVIYIVYIHNVIITFCLLTVLYFIYTIIFITYFRVGRWRPTLCGTCHHRYRAACVRVVGTWIPLPLPANVSGFFSFFVCVVCCV